MHTYARAQDDQKTNGSDNILHKWHLTRSNFTRSVPKQIHSRLWTFFGTRRIKTGSVPTSCFVAFSTCKRPHCFRHRFGTLFLSLYCSSSVVYSCYATILWQNGVEEHWFLRRRIIGVSGERPLRVMDSWMERIVIYDAEAEASALTTAPALLLKTINKQAKDYPI